MAFSRGFFSLKVFFSNGKIHWIMLDLLSETRKILTFDLANERYGEFIQLPETPRLRANYRWSLGVEGEGCLLLSCGHKNNDSTSMDVWTMKEYEPGQFWNKIASIPLRYPWTTAYDKSVFISQNGEILFHCWKDLELYNPERDSSRKLPISEMICRKSLKVDVYKESLVWLEGEAKKEPIP